MAETAPVFSDASAAAALDALPSAVLVYDSRGAVRFANQRARAILAPGSSPLPADVRSLFGFLPHLELPDGDNQSFDLPPREGSPGVPVGYRVEPFQGAPGDPQYHAVVFRDISEILASRRREVRSRSIDSISRLVPTIAHQILNPLSGIQSLLEVLLEETGDPKHRDDLRSALADVDRLRALVRSLGLAERELARPGSPVDAVAVVRETLELVRPRAEQKRVALAHSGAESLPLEIDPDVLRLILQALLSNALDASAPSGRISVALGAGNGGWWLEVADTGCGMPEEILTRAADPFFSTRPGASGIGLTLASETVRRSGGELTLTSTPDRGTTVTVRIPRP